MKELERISDYITQLENERAELNKQIDALKSDIEELGYRVKNNDIHSIRGIGYKTRLVQDLATNMQDRVDVLQAEPSLPLSVLITMAGVQAMRTIRTCG